MIMEVEAPGEVPQIAVVPGSTRHRVSSRPCTLAATIDEVGGATPAAARERLLGQGRHEFDPTQPDEVHGSGDVVTAIYLIDRPDLDPTHRYYQKAVTERRGDGRWYVIDTNQCESWTA